MIGGFPKTFDWFFNVLSIGVFKLKLYQLSSNQVNCMCLALMDTTWIKDIN